ncbi:MAG: hypothetical protein ACTHZM_07880 [Canibacter sp.]
MSSRSFPNVHLQPTAQSATFSRRWRTVCMSIITLCAIIFGTGIGPFAPSPAAHAAGEGAGLAFPNLWLGQYVTEIDGQIAYCIEVYRPTPYGAQELPAENLVTLPGFESPAGTIKHPEMSGESLRHLNYVLSRYGTTQSNDEAASVQYALWLIRAGNAPDGSLSIIEDIVRESGRADLLTRGRTIANEAQSFDYGGAASHADPPKIHMSTAYEGVITLAPGTTEVSLSQAVFTDTGKSSREFSGTGLAEAQTFDITGIPNFVEGSWDRYYEITASGKYRYKMMTKTVTVYQMNHGLQKLISKPTAEPEVKTGTFATQTVNVDTRWKPVLTTKTPTHKVPKGEHFSDTVTFDVADDSAPWRHADRDGKRFFVPITAEGTLYGPFLSDPAKNPSATPPNGAPVAAKATVTSDERVGPSTIEVHTEEVSREAGYYTWQWEIDGNNQTDSVTSPRSDSAAGATGESSLPENYKYRDGFGVAEEGQYTDMEIHMSTELSHTEIKLGEDLTDTVTVSLASRGGWLQGEDGQRIPITLRGELYQTDTKPHQQETIPPDANKLLDFAPITVTGPDDSISSDPVTIPLASSGWVTALWCIREEDQPKEIQGLVKETCDDFGVPTETAEVLRPEVTTTATPNATVFEEIHDVAEVTGHLPLAKTRVVFDAYLAPEAGDIKYDESWTPMKLADDTIATWTSDELAKVDSTCELQPVAHTDPVEVTKVGTVTSPKITATSVGTLYWVEELQAQDPQTQEWVTLHRGECGLPNETTEISPPNVTTQAIAHAQPGDKIHDTAVVDGPLVTPEGGHWELSFEAYHKPTDAQSKSKPENTRMPSDTSEDTSWCTDETKIWESSRKKSITEPGKYRSESFKVRKEHLGEVLWVETLQWKSDEFGYQHQHRGECGAKNEITVISDTSAGTPTPHAASLAHTGSSAETTQLLIWLALGVIGVGGVSIFAAQRTRKNRRKESEAQRS